MAFEAGSSSNSKELVDEKQTAEEKKSALIVDDCDVVRVVSAKVLRHFGYEVSEVTDGEEAVNLYKAGQADFDLIIMDLEMPIKNGIEATKELRAMGVDCMIIGVTASNNESQLQSFREAGLNHLFNKPMCPFKLQICLNGDA